MDCCDAIPEVGPGNCPYRQRIYPERSKKGSEIRTFVALSELHGHAVVGTGKGCNWEDVHRFRIVLRARDARIESSRKQTIGYLDIGEDEKFLCLINKIENQRNQNLARKHVKHSTEGVDVTGLTSE